MNGRTYYNELDPFAAAWLRRLIDGGHIAPGDVDERSIVDVRPDDVRGYAQCHWFAGIGGWSYALRLAGFPDDGLVWTGSCPCQPFSAAGQGKAADDERHLWPAWLPLIAECRPHRIFGEQVAAAIGWGWLDLVLSDLEACGYACGATVLPACSIGAPHIRERVWFGADAASARRDGARQPEHGEDSGLGRLADADGRDASSEGLQRGGEHGQQPQDGGAGIVGDARGAGLSQRERDGRLQREALGPPAGQAPVGGGNSHWSDAIWLPCTDGKARPTQPGIFPLAHGVPNRVGTLRGAGNAIVPQTAAAFIAAYLDTFDRPHPGGRPQGATASQDFGRP